MTILNILCGLKLTGLTIGWIVTRFVREAAPMIAKPKADDRNIQAAVAAAEQQLKEAIGAVRPFGREVGFVERQIYFYGLLTGVSAVISGVLILKAFFAWIDVKQQNATDEDRYMSLARFYGYAIANFVSLLWALLIFEGVRLLFVTHRAWPALDLVIPLAGAKG